jgi:hypothetical protein
MFILFTGNFKGQNVTISGAPFSLSKSAIIDAVSKVIFGGQKLARKCEHSVTFTGMLFI